MELILNTNELGYKPFLNTEINSFIIGFKNFCINNPYSLNLKNIKKAINDIKGNNQKIYISLNTFAKEKDIKKLKKVLNKLITLNVDGFVISDLGILNLLKEHNVRNNIILDLQTYITNKYSGNSLLNLGVDRICLSKEITINDIKEISSFNNNSVELLVQGYYPITYSKRPILSCYLKNFKLKIKSNIYYIKEESRDDYYYLLENKNNLSVYYNKQYSLFNHLPTLIENKINHLRIDSIFLEEKEIKEYIHHYSEAIKYINENKIDKFIELKEEFNKIYCFDTPFIQNESFLLKEGK